MGPPREVAALQHTLHHAAYASREAMYVHRLHALLLWACLGSLRQAAALCGDSPRSLERWQRRFESGGDRALFDQPHGGRRSLLSPAQLQRLRSMLFDGADARHPPTVRELHDRLADSFGTPLSLRQCRRLMAVLRQGAPADMAVARHSAAPPPAPV
jgi:hypothetical protein